MATVNNVSLELSLKELNSLVKIFTDASQSNETRIQLESGKLSLPKMEYTNKIMKFLTKQKSKSSSSRDLCGENLHVYLVSLIIRYTPSKNEFPQYSENNFDKLSDFLRGTGKKIIKFTSKKLFSEYCRYGYFLNKVFHLYREKLYRKEVTVPFSIFVQEEFEISDRHALRLRRIGELWFRYKRLENLAITIEEFSKRIKEIESLMNNYKNLAAYWTDDNDTNLASILNIKVE